MYFIMLFRSYLLYYAHCIYENYASEDTPGQISSVGVPIILKIFFI